MKKTHLFFVFIAVSLMFLAGCGKDNMESDEVLNITPYELMQIVGKDWNSVSAKFEKKKGYWYSELTDPVIRAAVSLPAVDRQSPVPGLNYKLTINVNRQNKVTFANLNSFDTSSVANGNKLMLYCYNNAFTKLNELLSYYASDSNGQAPRLTIEELLSKLNALNCQYPSLFYTGRQLHLSSVYFSNNGSFSFNASTN